MITALIAAASFSSIDAAALAALADARGCSQNRRECGGVIYEDGGAYFYTAPVTSGRPNGVDLGPLWLLGLNIVADFHTHPCVGVKQLNEVFSPGDVLSNSGLKVPGYMLSLCSGVVRRWAIGDSPDDFEIDYSSGRTVFCATGHIVGFVYEERI